MHRAAVGVAGGVGDPLVIGGQRQRLVQRPAIRANPNQRLISRNNPSKADQSKLKERLYEDTATDEGCDEHCPHGKA
jgi:hypothetical protein